METIDCKSAARVAWTSRATAIWQEHIEIAEATAKLSPETSRAVEFICASMIKGGQLLVAGNGGSAADAQHIVAELTGRFLLERRPLRAIALHGNASALTAVANDYGFKEVFSRELAAHGRPGDIFLAISTSGNSANIVRAIETARKERLIVIGLTGLSGGKMLSLCDLCLCVPSHSTARIQEMHIAIGHIICELVEERLAECFAIR